MDQRVSISPTISLRNRLEISHRMKPLGKWTRHPAAHGRKFGFGGPAIDRYGNKVKAVIYCNSKVDVEKQISYGCDFLLIKEAL